MVRPRGDLDRVDGDLHIAVRAVLEADRGRQARRQLAVHLGLSVVRAPIAPQLIKSPMYCGEIVSKELACGHGCRAG